MKRFVLNLGKKLFLMALLLSSMYITILGAIFNDIPFKVSASPGTVVAIDPTSSTAEPDQYFTINLTITDVTDLYNWGAKIRWQAGLLSTHENNVTEGPFLKQGGATSFTKRVYASYVDIGSTLIGIVPGVTGSGTLATITFKILESGNCTLELDPTRTTLYNSTFGLIDRTLQDGYFYTNSPVALFTYSPYYDVAHPENYGRPLIGETVTFNATASYDPDGGDIVSYQWDFGDGTTEVHTGANLTAFTTHTYSEPRPDPRPGGNIEPYKVELWVIDDEGKTDSSEPRVLGGPVSEYTTVRVRLHDIAVTNVTVIPTRFSPGATVAINVTVLNKGTVTEYLNVTVYQNFNPVKTFRNVPPPPSVPYPSITFVHKVGPLWTPSLIAGENATTTILWDTTGIYPGNYTLGIYVFLINPSTKESVPDIEKDEVLPDNWMLYGTITATEAGHDIAITDIKVDPTDLKIDEFSNIEVTIKNDGNVDEQYNATLTIHYGPDLFKQKEWSNQTLMAGATAILELKYWLQGANTTKEGDYNITASVMLVNATTLDFLEPYNATVPDDDSTDNTLSVSTSIQMLPVVNFTYSPSQPLVDMPTTFDASASYTPGIPGGTITEYSWEFGDGTTGTGNITTHVYRLSGRYTLKLTVTDDSDQTSFVQTEITVRSDMAHILMNITFSPSVAMPGQSVSVRVTVRNVGYFEETFNVTAYYDENKIGTETDITLECGANTTLTFTWDTTGVARGYYTIKTVASKLKEAELVENTCIGGTVAIGIGGMVPTSNVTISASPSSLNIGTSTIINGSISPVSAGARVMIHFRLREAETWSNLTMVITDQDGKYASMPWEPPKIGIYALKSILLGEDATLLGESEVEIMVVEESAPPPNIFFYTTIGLAAGLAAVIVGTVIYFIKVKKPKS